MCENLPSPPNYKIISSVLSSELFRMKGKIFDRKRVPWIMVMKILKNKRQLYDFRHIKIK